MYAKTNGFYDTLRYVFEPIGEAAYTLMSRVWKAFEALLQYCCLTDYKEMADKMVEDKMKAVDQIKSEFEEYKNAYDLEN